VSEILWKFPRRICLLESYYMVILTYGAETWTWIKPDISRLMTAEIFRKYNSSYTKDKRNESSWTKEVLYKLNYCYSKSIQAPNYR
jgi:isocitrate dehydrogenase kinase/phosphatase